jgi:hypothetical protein
MDILGHLVQNLLEVGGDIDALLFKRIEHGHQNLSGMSARVGLGTKAGLAGNDRGSKVPLGKIIFRRDGSVFRPEVESFLIVAEDILEVWGHAQLAADFHEPSVRLLADRFLADP